MGRPNRGIEPGSPALQADSLPAEPQGKPKNNVYLFWPHFTTCEILVPLPEIKRRPSAVETWSPNHWTTREVLRSAFIPQTPCRGRPLGFTCVASWKCPSAQPLSSYTVPHPSVQPESLPPPLPTAVRTFHLG